MARRVTTETRTRHVTRNGKLYSFHVNYDPGYNYTILVARVWTGHEWKWLHRIEIY